MCFTTQFYVLPSLQSKTGFLITCCLGIFLAKTPVCRKWLNKNLCDLQQPTRCFRLSCRTAPVLTFSPRTFFRTQLIQRQEGRSSGNKQMAHRRTPGTVEVDVTLRFEYLEEGPAPAPSPKGPGGQMCPYRQNGLCWTLGTEPQSTLPAWPRAPGSSALPRSKVRCLLLRRWRTWVDELPSCLSLEGADVIAQCLSSFRVSAWPEP